MRPTNCRSRRRLTSRTKPGRGARIIERISNRTLSLVKFFSAPEVHVQRSTFNIDFNATSWSDRTTLARCEKGSELMMVRDSTWSSAS